MHDRHHPPAHYRRLAIRKAERDKAEQIARVHVGAETLPLIKQLTQTAAREILKEQGGSNGE